MGELLLGVCSVGGWGVGGGGILGGLNFEGPHQTQSRHNLVKGLPWLPWLLVMVVLYVPFSRYSFRAKTTRTLNRLWIWCP